MPSNTSSARKAPSPTRSSPEKSHSESDSESHTGSQGSSSSESELSSDASTGRVREHMDRALRKEQRVKNDAISEAKELKKQLANATNSIKPGRRRRRRAEVIPDPQQQKEVKTAARKFTATRLLWLRKPESTFKLTEDTTYEPADRFQSLDNLLQGQLRDLKEVIPSRYHRKLGDGLVCNTFTSAANDVRSLMAHRIRVECLHDIFRSEDGWDRGELTGIGLTKCMAFRDQIGWVWDDEARDSGHYECMCPILYKDWHGRIDINTVFLNPLLFSIYSAIFRGPTSLRKTETGEPSSKVYEKLWEIDEVYIGAIALCAILARFALSEDTELIEQGKNSRINWRKDFEFYVQYISEGILKKKKPIIDMISTWNQYFYPDGPNTRSNHANNTDVTDDASTNAALVALNAAPETDDMEGAAGPNAENRTRSQAGTPPPQPPSPTVHSEAEASRSLHQSPPQRTPSPPAHPDGSRNPSQRQARRATDLNQDPSKEDHRREKRVRHDKGDTVDTVPPKEKRKRTRR